jgi:hypothetical protein
METGPNEKQLVDVAQTISGGLTSSTSESKPEQKGSE